jgi:hypothetical protein
MSLPDNKLSNKIVQDREVVSDGKIMVRSYRIFGILEIPATIMLFLIVTISCSKMAA